MVGVSVRTLQGHPQSVRDGTFSADSLVGDIRIHTLCGHGQSYLLHNKTHQRPGPPLGLPILGTQDLSSL